MQPMLRASRTVQGPPFRPKLKLLTERFLKRSIQSGEHDSIEDACAAMELVQLKLRSLLPAFLVTVNVHAACLM